MVFGREFTAVPSASFFVSKAICPRGNAVTPLAKSTEVTTVVLTIREVAELGADAKAALPTLKALKTNPDQSVRDAAAAAILKISE